MKKSPANAPLLRYGTTTNPLAVDKGATPTVKVCEYLTHAEVLAPMFVESKTGVAAVYTPSEKATNKPRVAASDVDVRAKKETVQVLPTTNSPAFP
jgi:hypothetical protein